MRDFWSNPIVGLVSVLCLCALLAFGIMRGLVPLMERIGRAASLAATRAQTRPPGAQLAFPQPLSGSFDASGTFDVPLPQGKYSEPSLQYYLYDYQHRLAWEAGIIHARRYNYRLSGYIAEHSSTSSHITYLAPIANGAHALGISREGDTIVFRIDGEVAHRFNQPAIADTPLRLTIDTAFAGSGEQATGSFWALHVTGGGYTVIPEPRCASGWGGVQLVSEYSHWVLKGTTDMAKVGSTTRYCHTPQ